MNVKKFALCLCLLVVTFFFFCSELIAAPRDKLRAKATILMNMESGTSSTQKSE